MRPYGLNINVSKLINTYGGPFARRDPKTLWMFCSVALCLRQAPLVLRRFPFGVGACFFLPGSFVVFNPAVECKHRSDRSNNKYAHKLHLPKLRSIHFAVSSSANQNSFGTGK